MEEGRIGNFEEPNGLLYSVYSVISSTEIDELLKGLSLLG